MSSLIFLVPIGILLGIVALAAFLWSLRSGQYEDLDGAATRIFLEKEGDRASEDGMKSARDEREEGRKK